MQQHWYFIFMLHNISMQTCTIINIYDIQISNVTISGTVLTMYQTTKSLRAVQII